MSLIKFVDKNISVKDILNNEHIIILDPVELRCSTELKYQSFKHALNKSEGFKVTISSAIKIGRNVNMRVAFSSYTHNYFELSGTVNIPAHCDSNIVIGVQDKTVYLLDEDQMVMLASAYEETRGLPLHKAYIKDNGPTGPRYTIVSKDDELEALSEWVYDLFIVIYYLYRVKYINH